MPISNPLTPLIQQLTKLPGIGEKSAQRLAFSVLSWPAQQVDTFAQTMVTVKNQIRYCKTCFNLSLEDECDICKDETRDGSTLCIVSEPKDLFAIERMGSFNGRYHVLGGLISPIDGIHPEVLRIRELLDRVAHEQVTELILAISSSIEGEATSLYLQNLFQPKGIRITRLASGLPMGADIDYTDDLTLQKAMMGRQPLS